jgi:hypothetical protein
VPGEEQRKVSMLLIRVKYFLQDHFSMFKISGFGWGDAVVKSAGMSYLVLIMQYNYVHYDQCPDFGSKKVKLFLSTP